MSAPLRGLQVLDLSLYAPGPYATLILAALGAEVLKIEPPPSGDPLRALDPEAFERLNAGKKSVLLDLKTEKGRNALRRLARSADVLIEGFRPGVMNRLSLDYESLRAEAPQLVYLSLTGYGQDGPYRDRAGHDVNYLALAGALDGSSLRPPVLQTADFAAGGLYAAVAVLSSLVNAPSARAQRERSESRSEERWGPGAQNESRHRGRYVDLSMHAGVLSMAMLATGQAAQRLSGSFPGYGIYRTRDGRHLSVGALEPKFWKAFCAGIERADLEPRDLDPKAVAEVSRVIESRDLTFWTERFSRIDACVEPVLTPDEARVQPQALHRGRGPGFSLPFLAGGLPPPDLPRAPFLGEHTPLASDAGAEDLG